jgi:hypothetical protein
LLSVVCDGAESPVIVSFLAVFSDPIAPHIIETKKNFDKTAQIVSSQEIGGRQTEQQRQDQTQRLCARGLHAAEGYPTGRKVLRRGSHHSARMWWGTDTPSNMQWQTVVEAKIKDRTERNCRRE